MKKLSKNSPKVLGLDVSTKTIGWSLFDLQNKELLELTHISPKVNIDEDKNKILLLKSDVFKEKLLGYVDMGITKVVIEEPLLNSNNVYTISTLMRFNSYISKIIYDELKIVPDFISTYESRSLGFPELVRKNKNGKFVLFGGFPKTIDKKKIIWDLVSRNEPQITWLYNKRNVLKKECFDMSDAYTCVLGQMKKLKIW